MTESSAGRLDVSVIIAAYNCGQFVNRAIQSALSQANVSLEVIVINDCSTDNTSDVVKDICALDPRVSLLSLPSNQGPSAARNAGLAAARAPLIAVLDADDAFAEGRLSRLKAAADSSGADLIADNFLYYNALTHTQGEPALRTEPAREMVDIHEFVARARPYASEADYGLLKPIYRKSFLQAHDIRYPTNARHGEDFLTYMSILLAGGKFLLVRQPGYLYTIRSSGLSQTVIDYTSQINAIRAISSELSPKNPRLNKLLTERQTALFRLNAVRTFQNLASKRDYIGLVSFLVGDPRSLFALLSHAAQKVRKRLSTNRS